MLLAVWFWDVVDNLLETRIMQTVQILCLVTNVV